MSAVPRARRVHRVLGALLVLPFLLWTGTGLLFLVKPGWSGAYEMLSAFRAEPLETAGLVALAELPVPQPARVEVATTALGPVFRVTAADGARHLVDARTGALLSPLAREPAVAVALDAAARAAAVERYGAPKDVHEDADEIAVTFSGGATVHVGRNDLALRQSGADTARIERLYRIHYLQWTGVEGVDRVLVVLAIVFTWVLAALGLSLLRRQGDPTPARIREREARGVPDA
jgi:hypothetical protein